MSLNNTNGLLLYLHTYSFYAQRVVMAMHEKKLNFKSVNVDIGSGEQYEPWYLEINPRGEVPVLKDGVKIIPDSNRIVDYLEDNFSNGGTPRLIPIDQGNEVKQKVIFFRELIDSVPANTVTIGCCYHPEAITNPRLPFIAPVRAIMKASDGKQADKLRSLAAKYPQYSEVLLEKAKKQESNHLIVSNKENFNELLQQVEITLEQVEKQLATVTDTDWLVNERFTIADVNLSVLLERLSQVGLAVRLWAGTQDNRVRPFIHRYYEKIQTRPSFRHMTPNAFSHIKTLIGGKVLAGIGGAAVIASIAGAIYFSRNSRSSD